MKVNAQIQGFTHVNMEALQVTRRAEYGDNRGQQRDEHHLVMSLQSGLKLPRVTYTLESYSRTVTSVNSQHAHNMR